MAILVRPTAQALRGEVAAFSQDGRLSPAETNALHAAFNNTARGDRNSFIDWLAAKDLPERVKSDVLRVIFDVEVGLLAARALKATPSQMTDTAEGAVLLQRLHAGDARQLPSAPPNVDSSRLVFSRDGKSTGHADAVTRQGYVIDDHLYLVETEAQAHERSFARWYDLGPLDAAEVGSVSALVKRYATYLGSADQQAQLATLAQQTADAQPQLGDALGVHLAHWLGQRRPFDDVRLRLEIARDSGYLLVDDMLLGDGRAEGGDPLSLRRGNDFHAADDRKGWSLDELRQAQAFIAKLPAQMRPLYNLRFWQRDARSLMRADAIGEANTALRTMAFYSDSAPTQKLMAHELGHMVHIETGAQRSAWDEFYSNVGRTEVPTDYARTNSGEGFADAFAWYALWPERLSAKSPKTFAWMRERFGDALSGLKGAQAFDAGHGLCFFCNS